MQPEAMKQHNSLAVEVDFQRMQLISPPPEEILSLQWASGSRISTYSTPSISGTATAMQAGIASKRKRAPLTPAKPPIANEAPKTAEITPNPKPRKQRHVRVSSVESPTRKSSSPPLGSVRSNQEGTCGRILTTPTKSKKKVVVQSPHEKNPDADYIPVLVLAAERGQELQKVPNASVRRVLLSARGSRRSATPIPPYEPPPDIFTPPREVFLRPAPTKSAPKRKESVGRQARARTKGKELRVNTHVQVKQEIPDDIDLLAPMPPPSPTDDPLLLSGPPEPMLELQDREASPTTPAGRCNRSMVAQRDREKEDLPPSSPVSPDADAEPVRLFEIDTAGADGSWSDSDDDGPNRETEEEGEGEFTGRWRMMKVRTKQDPPSSATRTRQELWGRPISPFPNATGLALVDEEEEEEEVRRLSIEPESEGGELQDRELSRATEEGATFEDTPALEGDVQDDDSSDIVDQPGLIKITSADPRAAARAVAILKQHDYDCYTKLNKQRRASHSALVDLSKESRRKDLTSAGIMKTTDRRRRRSTMGVIGDRVIIPGSPVTTLPDLLQLAEEEIIQSSVRSARTTIRQQASPDSFKTPLSAKFANKERGSITTIPEQYPVGEREWTRKDWKVLDACFTDQRINLGDSHDTLAQVDLVVLQDVVDRFISLMGGQSLVDTFGEAWSRNNLLERTKALQKKQRSGSVAPSTPMSTFSVLSFLNFPNSSNATDFLHSTTDAPDSTPTHLGRHEVSDKSVHHRSVQQTSMIDEPLFYEGRQRSSLPPTLLAPRYSHLLEEAGAINDLGPSSNHLEDNATACGDEQASDLLSDSPSDFTETNIERVTRNPVEHLCPRRLESAPHTNNFGERLKGFFSSYLPKSSKQPLTFKKTPPHGQPCLPLPPPSVLEKPRGPVATPVRPSVHRAPPPKDLVHLNHVSLPPSNIPRPKPILKRLVELVPVPETAIKPETTFRDGVVQRPRRSSGSSVKDLVKGFEEMEKTTDGRLGGYSRGLKQGKGRPNLRPTWKP